MKRGTEKKCPTFIKKSGHSGHPPPLISCGKADKDLMGVLFSASIGGERFNLKAYCRERKLARSTVYNRIYRLERLGLITKENQGVFVLSEEGKQQFSKGNKGVHNLRRECPKAGSLSVHYLDYVLAVKSRKGFDKGLVGRLSPNDIKVLRLKNLEQVYLYFDDATVIINPKQVRIRVRDLVGDDEQKLLLEGLEIAVGYAERLEGINIVSDGLSLEQAHYARMESVLSGFLGKVDKRYFLDLGGGRKFWVDNSGGKVEDETNSVEVRERLDSYLRDVVDSESLMSDVDKMKEVLGCLIKVKVMEYNARLKRVEPDLGKPDYML